MKSYIKKILVIPVITIFSILNCVAQPNPGFEDWHTEATYQVPDNWATFNFFSLLIPPSPLSAIRVGGLDKHSGNFALKIVTIPVYNNPAPDIVGDTVGLVFTGKIIFSPPQAKYGFPYTGRPEKLEFWAKYSPVGNDTASASVALFKWNGTGYDSIAAAEINVIATSIYTKFQGTLFYNPNISEFPDSALIVFASSKRRALARVGSTLYVDDVAFTGSVGIDDRTKFADKVKLFPNPAKDNLTIQTQIDDASNVKVFDVSGKQVGEYKIKNCSVNINTGLFAEGIYFYEIGDKKDRVLTKGKFNVIK